MNRYPLSAPGCGTLLATFLAFEALPTEQAWALRTGSKIVFSCDYNGWADVPEEEREGIDAFEASPIPPRAAVKVALALAQSLPGPRALLQRKAA